METLYPASHAFNSSYLMQDCKSTIWTKEENKKFESALALYDKDTPDRWIKIADMIPGKSVLDVMKQYQNLVADISDIEAGLVPLPGYLASSCTLEWMKNGEFNGFKKRPMVCRSPDQEKKKGVPWTEEEHRRFLMGLQKHGKGDWRNISRNFVITKTSTQVASHAQKYYLRQQLAEGKEKRRPSIHDITTVHLASDAQSDNQKFASHDRSTLMPRPEKCITTPKMFLDRNHLDNGSVMDGNTTYNNLCVPYSHENALRDFKIQKGGARVADFGLLDLGFQFQSTKYQIW